MSRIIVKMMIVKLQVQYVVINGYMKMYRIDMHV